MSSVTTSISKAPRGQLAGTGQAALAQRAAIGVTLAVAATFGLSGDFLSGALQTVFFSISSLGLIAGSALFATRLSRLRRTTSAAGFAVLALGESIMLAANVLRSGGAGESLFSSAVALYVVAFLLISVPKAFALWTRITGTLAAVPFAVYVALWLGGASPSADGPVVGVGWMMFTVTIVGWIIAAVRQLPRAAMK